MISFDNIHFVNVSDSMGQEKYNLKWNEFEKSFCQSVRNIRKTNCLSKN